jgi:5-methylcytosine-specific restriction endonuclease McrA
VVRERGTRGMRPARLAAPTAGRTRTVGRPVAGSRPNAGRSVPRPTYTIAPMRPPEPPVGPSRRDVLRLWEELDVWSCAYCDAPFGEMVVAEVDHIHPLAKGGCHDWVNLAPACRTCNREKADLDIGTWLAKIAGQDFTSRSRPVTECSADQYKARTHGLHKVTTW